VRVLVLQTVARAIVVVLLGLAVAGCGFRFLETYDSTIESGISDYHKSTIDYLTRIVQNPTAPENDYTSAASQKYYAASAAQLADLVVRADTNSGPRCVPDQLTYLTSYVQSATAHTSASVATYTKADVNLAAGTCTAVALRIVQADHKRMQSMHQRRTLLGKYNAQLWSDLVGDSTRMALVIVKATKP
jgi:hypothetical protein